MLHFHWISFKYQCHYSFTADRAMSLVTAFLFIHFLFRRHIRVRHSHYLFLVLQLLEEKRVRSYFSDYDQRFSLEWMEAAGENTFDILFERSLAILAREYGFERIEVGAYHQFLDLSNNILRRLLLNVKHLMEVQLRTEPSPSDLARALQLMNVKFSSLQQTLSHPIKHRLRSPDRQNETHPQKLFRVTQTAHNSSRKVRPIYIPDFLPEFPDSHTFISSETYADIRKDYPRVRQLLADQRRSLQRSLVKFKLQTNDRIPVIVNQSSTMTEYYLIKNTLSPLPYLSALLPQDQLDSDHTDAIDDETAGNLSHRTQSLSATEDGEI